MLPFLPQTMRQGMADLGKRTRWQATGSSESGAEGEFVSHRSWSWRWGTQLSRHHLRDHRAGESGKRRETSRGDQGARNLHT
jgi:hypothetical protein